MSHNHSKSPSKHYSVFVGQLPLEVTTQDLRDLFSDCGDITELFIAKQSKEMCYTFGFVRYKTIEAARRAVSDLNGWQIKGGKIRAELSKETRHEFHTAREGVLQRQQSVEKSISTSQHSEVNTNHFEGLKNYGQLRDMCGLMNVELAGQSDTETSRLDLDKLTAEINKENNARLPTRVSKVYDIDTSLESAKKQLLTCKCSKSCDKDNRADEFMESLKLIITNIDSFLQRADRKCHSESKKKEKTSFPVSDSENNNWDMANGSPTMNNYHSTNGNSKKPDINNDHRDVRSKSKERISSSEEESGFSCGEELCSSLNSSSDASFSQTSRKSLETFVQTVLGRGRGFCSPNQRSSHPSPGTA